MCDARTHKRDLGLMVPIEMNRISTMNLRLTDSEMLEKRCQAWERTRQRGQFLYGLTRGAILGGGWFLFNTLGNVFAKNNMSYESMAVASIVFFLMGCLEAPRSWNRAEGRYEADKRYLEAMKQQDSSIVS